MKETGSLIKIPPNAARIIDLLKAAGFEAWVVGGCVRDALLGRAPDDWDLTTCALPDEVRTTLEKGGVRVISGSGLKHGTVSAVFAEDGGHKCYEITTYRSEGKYSDARHPDGVSFVSSLEVDLSRRDLTINAMAADGERIVDLFGGKEDLCNRSIRAVGEPEKRFREDALRILRALRFASQLGFEIESKTLSAIRELAPIAANVSAQRRIAELDKLLAGEYRGEVIERYGDILDSALGIARDESACVHLSSPNESDPDILFALYFGDDAPDAARKLKLSNRRHKAVSDMIEASRETIPETIPETLRFLRLYNNNCERCLKFRAAIEPRSSALKALETITSLRAQNVCFELSSLNVSGDDLVREGISGEAIGKSLEKALDAVIDGIIPNEKDALLTFIKRKS